MEDKSKNINPVNTQASVQPGVTDSVVMDEKPHVLPAGHDDALEMFDGHPENFVFSSKESRRVLWKLDLILLPMVRLPFQGPGCMALVLITMIDDNHVDPQLHGQSRAVGGVDLWYPEGPCKHLH